MPKERGLKNKNITFTKKEQVFYLPLLCTRLINGPQTFSNCLQSAERSEAQLSPSARHFNEAVFF